MYKHQYQSVSRTNINSLKCFACISTTKISTSIFECPFSVVWSLISVSTFITLKNKILLNMFLDYGQNLKSLLLKIPNYTMLFYHSVKCWLTNTTISYYWTSIWFICNFAEKITQTLPRCASSILATRWNTGSPLMSLTHFVHMPMEWGSMLLGGAHQGTIAPSHVVTRSVSHTVLATTSS